MTGRITNQIISRNLLSSITDRQKDLINGQKQVSSGRMFEKVSENAVRANRSLILEKAISFHERMKENVATIRDFNYAADDELGVAGDVLQRARELSISAANEALNEQQIDGISSELDAILQRMSDIANTTHEGNYLFGGFQTTRAPFQVERNLSIDGYGLTELNLNKGSFKTRVEADSMTTVAAGSFALKGGDLILNGIDIGTFTVIEPTRTAADNTQTLVELINAKTKDTGLTAKAIQVPGGTFAAPGVAPLTGIALSNVDATGKVTNKDITITGNGFKGVGNIDVFRRERIQLGQTRLVSSQALAAGAIGNIAAGAMTINGSSIGAVTFAAGNTAEQNAQALATAINTVSNQTEVSATTDGNGFVLVQAQKSFTVAGAPVATNLTNGVIEQTRQAVLANGSTITNAANGVIPVSAQPVRLDKGFLTINGIEIFHEPLILATTLTSQERANAVVKGINAKAPETGVTAYADATGQVRFGNIDQVITQITYKGDTGERKGAVGQQELIPMHMSGDKAFSGTKDVVQLLSGINIPAAGFGSAVSTTPVSFAAGDTIGAGQLVINGTNITTAALTGVPATDATTVVAAINAQTGVTGVSAAVQAGSQVRLTSTTGATFTLLTSGVGSKINIPNNAGTGSSYLNAIAAGDLVINGVDIGAIAPVPANLTNPLQSTQDNATALVNAINAKADQSGVRAESVVDLTGSTRILLKASGQDIRITTNNTSPSSIFNAIGLQPGTEIKQSLNIFDALVNLRNESVNAKYIRDRVRSISVINVKEVDQALTALTSNRVEFGVRGQRAELVQNRADQHQILLKTQLSENQDTDVAKAISELTLDETSLKAALSLAPRMNELTLLNFLR